MQRLVVPAVALAVGLAVVPSARAADPSRCLAGGLPSFAPECLSEGVADPGYATDTDPSPGQPFALRVGAVHEHSSYSDGDPTAIPLDYFNAGRTGHNQAEDGTDTGVRLDFMLSSEHSDNAQIPITTSAACLDPTGWAACSHVGDAEHHRKWTATLEQAVEATDAEFTAMRGFEWTNDVYNHMNVYLSTNFLNVKIDGSYASMDVMWDWLRTPVSEGGGADGLVTFNHPGGEPSLTPFDDGMPHNALLASRGGANWNDLAYVPDVDDRVAGIEVNGGDDIEWYVRGLTNGWHIGPVAAEDEHEREWSSSTQGKTLMLTRGGSPQDYYFALQHHRTVAVLDELVGGAPSEPAEVPSILFYADGADVQDPAATVLGGTIAGGGTHVLNVELAGLPAGSRVSLVGSAAGGLATPIPLGAADAAGALSAAHAVVSPATGEDWWFVVVCGPGGSAVCGTDHDYAAVTAPIWLAP